MCKWPTLFKNGHEKLEQGYPVRNSVQKVKLLHWNKHWQSTDNFWDLRRILLANFLHEQCKYNAVMLIFLKNIKILKILKLHIDAKTFRSGPNMHLQDNAIPHITVAMKEKIQCKLNCLLLVRSWHRQFDVNITHEQIFALKYRFADRSSIFV